MLWYLAVPNAPCLNKKKSSPPLPQKKTKRKNFKYTKDYAFGASVSGSLSLPPLRLAAS